jgi:hypothetical protein
MRRYPILAALLVAIAIPATGLGSAASAVASPSSHSTRLVAFHFGGHRSFGGGGFLGGRRRSTHHVLRHVVHALAFAYVLHLLFSHGGVSILFWLIVIAVVLHLFRRRRRTRYA